MTTRSRRISRRTAERLLDGAPLDEPLAGLLRAAAAPARPAELSGERFALAAFRSARLDPVPERPRRVFRTRLATVKVAAAAVATLAAGGVAVAAATGQLPSSPTPASAAVTSAISYAGTTQPTTHPAFAPNSSGHQAAGQPDTPAYLAGMCHAYQAGAHPKDLDNPAFGRLVAAAGGKGAVAGYCVRLLGGPSETSQPSRTNPAGNVVPDPGGKSHSGGGQNQHPSH